MQTEFKRTKSVFQGAVREVIKNKFPEEVMADEIPEFGENISEPVSPVAPITPITPAPPTKDEAGNGFPPVRRAS